MFNEMSKEEILVVDGGHYGYAERWGNQVISDESAKVMGAAILATVLVAPVVGPIVGGIMIYSAW